MTQHSECPKLSSAMQRNVCLPDFDNIRGICSTTILNVVLEKISCNIRHFIDLIDPRKTCLLRFIVLILAIHAATSFEAAADDSQSSNDAQPNQEPRRLEPGDLVLPNSAAFKAALAEYNETGMLVEFFLPWCGHSRRLRPELAQVPVRKTRVCPPLVAEPSR